MSLTEAVLARYAAGEVSREIALAQLLLTGSVPDPAGLPAPIAELAREHADRLPALAALAARGFDGSSVSDTAALFDRLAAEAPEAAVAFYSFGDPGALAAATDELVATIRSWAPVEGRDVLDFGCGIGRVALALAPVAREVIGLDLSAGMIAQARARADAVDNVRYVQGNGDHLPLGDRSIDLIVAADCFPFLVQAGGDVLDRQFAEFARALRSGGDLLVFNWSYRGDAAVDIAEAHTLGEAYGFEVLRADAQPFAIWDGRGFHLRRL